MDNTTYDPPSKVRATELLENCQLALKRNDITAVALGKAIRRRYPPPIVKNCKETAPDGKRYNCYGNIRMTKIPPLERQVFEVDRNDPLNEENQDLYILDGKPIRTTNDKEEDGRQYGIVAAEGKNEQTAIDNPSSFKDECIERNEILFIKRERDQLFLKISKIATPKLYVTNGEIEQKTRINPKNLTILKEVGRGSYGIVYMGKLSRSDRVNDSMVAVKCPIDKSNADVVKSFYRELKILNYMRLSKLENVQFLLGAIFDDSQGVLDKIVTTFVGVNSEPTALNRVLAKDIKYNFTLSKFLKFSQSLCKTLLSLHSTGLLHNDLKSNNVLVRFPDISAVIIDFGRACLIHESKKKKAMREQTQCPWVAPEVNKQLCAPSVYSDIFSVGYILQNSVEKMAHCGSLAKLTQLAEKCLCMEPTSRPSLSFMEMQLCTLPEFHLE